MMTKVSVLGLAIRRSLVGEGRAFMKVGLVKVGRFQQSGVRGL